MLDRHKTNDLPPRSRALKSVSLERSIYLEEFISCECNRLAVIGV